MTSRACVFLAALLVGCTPTVYVHTESPDEHKTEIRDAGKHLGVRTRIAAVPGKGVIELEFRPVEDRVCGQALEKLIDLESPKQVLAEGVVDCQPKAWSCSGSSMFLGHELGHILGLTHVRTNKDRKRWGVEGDDNLMDPAPKGVEISDRQKFIVQAAAVLMSETCR